MWSISTHTNDFSRSITYESTPLTFEVLQSNISQQHTNLGLLTSFNGQHPTVSTLILEDGASSRFIRGLSVQKQKICEAAQAKFLEYARSEYFEYGYTQPSERFLIEFSEEYPGLLPKLIQSIYLSESKDIGVTLALLNALGSIKYEFLHPHGQILAIAALSNPAPEVKEAAIRVFEAWGNQDGAKILANVECHLEWLDKYRKQVITDLGGS